MERLDLQKTKGSDYLSANFFKDCARAEEEALKTLSSVYMPVINMQSIRNFTLANYKARMKKCDQKVPEKGIVLVAITDFVAACLSCPSLFGWNIIDSKEQVSALLADLGRRWACLLSADQSRRAKLFSLLETSLRCLDDQHLTHFHRAKEVGKQANLPETDTLGSPPIAISIADTLGSEPDTLPIADALGCLPLALPIAGALGSLADALGSLADALESKHNSLPKADALGSKPIALPKLGALGSPPVALPKSQRTLASFFPKSPAARPVAASDNKTLVFSANEVLLVVDPANHDTPVTSRRDEAQPTLPLVNNTNVSNQPLISSIAKPRTNALAAMMIKAKENKRKNTTLDCVGQGKRARKGQ